MKALVFGGPGQRSWDSVEDPGIQEPDRRHREGRDDDDLRHGPAHPQGRRARGHGGPHPRPRGGRDGGRDRRGGDLAQGGRPRARARDHLLRALRAVQGGHGRALRGGRRDRLDLRAPDRRRAGRLRPRAVRRDVGPRRPGGRLRRAGPVPRRHPPDGLRDRRAERRCRARAHDRGRRRGPGRAGGDDDGRDRRRGADHRRRHRAVTARAREVLRRDPHGARRARTPRPRSSS